jgi:hypothetical protein
MPGAKDIPSRILWSLLSLRASAAIEFKETSRGSGIFRYAFRAGGWPVTVDLDTSVVEMRVYHGRDEVAMVRMPERAMDQLLGTAAMPKDTAVQNDAAAAGALLRAAIKDWKSENPRIFIRPPVKVGHPDNWNHA